MNFRKGVFISLCVLSGVTALSSGIISVVVGTGSLAQIVLFGMFLGFALSACIMYNYSDTRPIIMNV
jgi:hypothetical protein